jgi:hypothetical protein
MVYTKENYNRDVNTIIPIGFKRMILNERVFIRAFSDKVERIDYAGREYFPHGAFLEGVIISVSFYSVENILNEILDKYHIKQRYGNSTIHAVLNDIEGIDYNKFETEIHDEASFQIVAEEIKKIVEYGAMPFFEKYDTLEKVFLETEKMSIDKMSNFISQPLPQRRMVIKKLCKDSNYNEYVKMVLDYYKSTNDPDVFIIEKLNDYLNEKFG